MYLVWYKPLKLFSSVQLEKKRLHMALLFISQFAKLHFGMVDVQKVYLPKFVLNNVGLLQKPARFRYIMLLTLDSRPLFSRESSIWGIVTEQLFILSSEMLL